MEAKEIIEKLKITFQELVGNPVAPMAPETAPEMIMPTKAKLMDGTEVEISELGVGGIVTIQGVPAPVGEHQLEDGTILVVGDNGAITEIKPSAPMVEDMKKMKMEEVFNSFQSSTNEKFTSYEAKFASYETRFADYESKLNKATQVIEGLINLTKTLAETPTGTPDVAVKTESNFKADSKISYDILFS
jgi:hypothetical protein